MTTNQAGQSIDEYLRRRLMPAEVAIPRLAGIDMYGSSIPASQVGGDLVEYVNFQQRYDVNARIARSEALQGVPRASSDGKLPRNLEDTHVEWMQSKPGSNGEDRAQPRDSFNTSRSC